jgi:RimJ/RimL family protein N-acetyltransferase
MSIGLSIRLRPIAFEHIPDIQALASDEAIARFTAIPHPYPVNGARAFVEQAQRLRARGLCATFAVCEVARCVGVVTLARDATVPERAELGYWIGRPFWGRGLATAAVGQILAHGFGRMRLAVVFARCFTENRASARVLETRGFRFVGLEVTRVAGGRSRQPVGRYELTVEAWRRAASR